MKRILWHIFGPIIIFVLAFLTAHSYGQTTQPVVMLRPPPGTVIENLNLDGAGGTIGEAGIYINCYPAPSDPNYVCHNLTIRNNRIKGFQTNIKVIGPNIGTQIYGNSLTDATRPDGNDSHGLYTEGLQQAQIHDNYIANNGWWSSYNPNDPVQRTQANRHHGVYMNESAGMDDLTMFWNNVVIDSAGSNVGCRHSLIAWNNVFRHGGDWDLIVGQWGKANAYLFSNACFSPRLDAIPYYGGGIHLLCPGQVLGNLFSGSAAITNNPAALDSTNAVIQQIGQWPKPGATTVPVGTKVHTLEEWCQAVYGVPNVSAIKPGDAPRIVAWLAQQQGQTTVQVVPATQPTVDVKVNGVTWGPK